MRVALLGLTGMANPVLESLAEMEGVDLVGVFTQTYDQPYPFYPERQLEALCAERSIPCLRNVRLGQEAGFALLRALAPDLILVATFKQILNLPVIELPRLAAVNLHPSLLPRHRGPCPIQAALLAGDRTTGVSAHFLTELADQGNIILSRELPIESSDDDGQLRRRLATLAGAMTPELVEVLRAGRAVAGAPQDETQATYAGRPDAGLAQLETAGDWTEFSRRFRAFHPFPGASYVLDGRRVRVAGCELAKEAPTGVPRTAVVRVGPDSVRIHLDP